LRVISDSKLDLVGTFERSKLKTNSIFRNNQET